MVLGEARKLIVEKTIGYADGPPTQYPELSDWRAHTEETAAGGAPGKESVLSFSPLKVLRKEPKKDVQRITF